MTMTATSPLQWPDGWARTTSRRHGPFKVTAYGAVTHLGYELERLGATRGRITLSSNVPASRSGKIVAEAYERAIEDPGVAVYFDLGGKPHVMARDAFLTPYENIRSIGLAVEAMRALERHGGATMRQKAFSGFSALPAPEPVKPKRPWHEVLGVTPEAEPELIEAAYRARAKRAHPDAGGSGEAMAELNAARDEALKAMGP